VSSEKEQFERAFFSYDCTPCFFFVVIKEEVSQHLSWQSVKNSYCGAYVFFKVKKIS
jgi:hypothetical protein